MESDSKVLLFIFIIFAEEDCPWAKIIKIKWKINLTNK